jgi:2-dehydro-3-deoxyphosphogluconate aldolase/(4S)-4-hydroxy-2-oxoglutarate aldolase
MARTEDATLELFRSVPVIPVVVIDDASLSVPLARALVAGGLGIIEITLRTAAGIEAIRRIAAEVPEAIVGAGSVLSPATAVQAEKAGARFLVSPGTTALLRAAFEATALPCLGGAATASEAMVMAEAGFTFMKFFPAETSGGVAALKALSGPLPHLTFCPTGGIDVQRAATYLGLPNVVCVGGSWITPADALRERAFGRIEALARAAVHLNDARPVKT